MAIHSANKGKIVDAIVDHQNFSIASMSGGVLSSTGQMPENLAREIKADKPIYVVYSYTTPIAWVKPNGQAVVPLVAYSATTSNHQGIARFALL